MKLRPPQQEAHDAIIEQFRIHQSTLLVQATGTGKTIVFAHVIKTFQPKRALVLAHRDELIFQAKDKIERVTGLPVSLEKADMVASASLFHRTPVVVSSIQTQVSGPKDRRRYRRFKPTDFGLLICDESHHATSPSWREAIDYYKQNPDLRVLGVTATPDRSDREALGQVFDSVAYEYGILDAIKDGYLVDITQQFVPVASLDFSHIRTTAGDLNEGDLSKVMEAEENIQGVCQPSLEVMFGLPPKTLSEITPGKWRDYLAGLKKRPRRTIVFTVSVMQAEQCASVFSRAMDGVGWVCGKTRKDDRRLLLDRFASGDIHAMMNCGVLLEGFDNPGVEVIVMARPTKSRALYAQAVGRSTRPLPGIVDGLDTAEQRRDAIARSAKPYCRILDFVGNSGKHKLISCADILGGHVSERAAERAKAKAMEDGKPVRMLVTMTNAEIELEKQRLEAIERARLYMEERRKHLLAKVDFKMQDVNPFSRNDSFKTGKSYTTDGRVFTEKQSAILRKVGVDPSSLMWNQGRAIIAQYFKVPSKEQAAVLKKFGYDPRQFDRKSASAKIDAIAANGWKRLETTTK